MTTGYRLLLFAENGWGSYDYKILKTRQKVYSLYLYIFIIKVLTLSIILFRILTGTYDNKLHIWTLKGKHRFVIPGHMSPVKAVAWISLDDDKASFVR